MISAADRSLALRIHDYISDRSIQAALDPGREDLDVFDIASAMSSMVPLVLGHGRPPLGSALETLHAVRATFNGGTLFPLSVITRYSTRFFPFFGTVAHAPADFIAAQLPALVDVADLLAQTTDPRVASRAATLATVLRRYLAADLPLTSPPHRLKDWSSVATRAERRILPELDSTDASATAAAESLALAAENLGLDAIEEVTVAVLDYVVATASSADQLDLPTGLGTEILDAVRTAASADSDSPLRALLALRAPTPNACPSALRNLLDAAPIEQARAYTDARIELVCRLDRHTGKDYPGDHVRGLFKATNQRLTRPSSADIEALHREMVERHRRRQGEALREHAQHRLSALPGQAAGKRAFTEVLDSVVEQMTAKSPYKEEPAPILLTFVGAAGCGQDALSELVTATVSTYHSHLSSGVEALDLTWGDLARDSTVLLVADSTAGREQKQRIVRISGSPEACEPALAALSTALAADARTAHVLISCSEQELAFLDAAVPELSTAFTSIALHSYDCSQLAEAVVQELARDGLTCADQAVVEIRAKLERARLWGDFRNLRLSEHLTRALVEHVRADPARTVVEAADVQAVAELDSGGPSAPEFSRALERLQSLIGLDAVKDAVTELMAEAQFREMRRAEGFVTASQSRHLVFTGNPGTAKTTVARLLGDIYSSLGLLSKGTMVEASREDLVSKYSGESATKTRDLIEKAVGGVLFIDEAYQLNDEKGSGHEAIGTLLRMMEDHRHDLVVVVAGYPKEMTEFLSVNPGLRSRFPRTIHFADYSVGELTDILLHFARENGFVLEPELLDALRRDFATWDVSRRQGNAREVRNVFERLLRARAISATGLGEQAGAEDLTVLRLSDFDQALDRRAEQRSRTLAEALAELEELIGLESIKEVVHTITAQAHLDATRRKRGLPRIAAPVNLVFQGNPGTGKTTIARLLSRILAGLGAVESGHLIEVTRADLVAQYIGQTAPKVMNVVSSARGGVLFIDEAYSLSPMDDTGRDFGAEALTTLMTAMENYRNDVVVILAGESEQMEDFLERHPSFAGRFSQTVEFPDYTEDELLGIFDSFAAAVNLSVEPGVRTLLASRLAPARRQEGFDNARSVRTVFENALRAQARRVSALLQESDDVDDAALTTLTVSDVDAATGALLRTVPTFGFTGTLSA